MQPRSTRRSLSLGAPRVLAVALAALVGLGGPALAQDSLPTTRVVMPWQDFKILYDKGQAPEDMPETAPRDFTISRAVYSGKVEDEATVFNANLRVDVLKDKGWVAVPVLPTSVALRQAKLGGKDAAITIDGNWYVLITDKKGPLSLDLEFAVSTFDSQGQAGFAFQLPNSGGTEVTVDVPVTEELEVEVANAQRVSQEQRGAVRRISALLPAKGNLSVTWQRAAVSETGEAAAALEARVYAETNSLVGVAEGLLECQSTVNYSILHAGVEQLRVSLPADVTLLDVQGQGIRDWSVATAGKRQIVTVDLNYEAEGAYRLTLDYEKLLPEGGGDVTVPDLQVVGAERSKAFIGVDARSNLEVQPGKATVARTIDVRELPAAIVGMTKWPVLMGFRASKEGWEIPLTIKQHEEVDMLVTIVDQLAATSVMTADGRRMTQVTYNMRNNRAQFLEIDLPKGSTPWSTFVAGRAVKPALADDGSLLVPLARSQSGKGDLARFAVEIVYVEDGSEPVNGAGTFTAALPTSDVPTTSVAWTVYLPRQAKVPEKSFDGTMRRVFWFTPIEVDGVSSEASLQQVRQQAQANMDSGAMGSGVTPVRVNLPIDGQAFYFEKLLVQDDDLNVAFDYKKLK